MRFMMLMIPSGREQAKPGVPPEVGPSDDAREMVGYWMIRVKSKEEAIAWARRCPASNDGVLEIRQVHDLET